MPASMNVLRDARSVRVTVSLPRNPVGPAKYFASSAAKGLTAIGIDAGGAG